VRIICAMERGIVVKISVRRRFLDVGPARREDKETLKDYERR